TEEIGSKRLDVVLGNPRCPEIGINVAGEHVLGLYAAEGFGVAAVAWAGIEDRGEFGADVSGKIHVGCLPVPGLGVMEDEIAQLGADLLLELSVEGGDEREIDHAAL